MARPVVVDGRFELFPEFEAYTTGFLDVGDGHRLFYEEAGNPQGQPVVFLHGGPGGQVLPRFRRFFDPEHYRIVLFDQRGAGQSLPHADLTANTTWDLVQDIEKLRQDRGIDQWLVFGGSWGTTLALAYAISHPERVSGLILRGIFLCRPWEIQWLYQQGASRLFPDAFDKFLALIPPAERGDMVTAYHQRLTHADPAIRLASAKAWSTWEAAISKLIPDPQLVEDFEEDLFALAFARIECHYFVNKGFFSNDNWILENIARIQQIPGQIVHGRYDVVCPVENAWELHKLWPASQLQITPDAGHSAMEPGTLDALIRATEAFKQMPASTAG